MPKYTLAGCETFANYVRLQDYLTPEEVSNFLEEEKCDSFLHSFGQDFSGKYDTHVQHELKVLTDCRKLYKNCDYILDSGGFQISINKIPRKDAPRYQELYYFDFLTKHGHLIDKAFILDMPPGPGCEMFTDFDDVYRWNLNSYLIAANLPEEIRRKIIYVHHFRTPSLWKIFTRIMREHELFDLFIHHGTGGLVANQSSDTATPQVLLIFPLIQLLNEAIKYKRKHLTYHVLGNATFRDVLFYHLFEIHVAKCHGIKLTISFDSSGLFKGIMKGRYIQIIDNDYSVSKVSLKEADLDKRCQRSMTYREKFKETMYEICSQTSLREPPKDLFHEIYYWQEKERKNGTVSRVRTFHPVVRLYIAINYLHTYVKANNLLKPLATELYSLYEDNRIEEFNMEIMKVTSKINFGKITRKQKKKTEGIASSLKILENLDENHCEYLVKKYLEKDEFDLDNERKVLTI